MKVVPAIHDQVVNSTGLARQKSFETTNRGVEAASSWSQDTSWVVGANSYHSASTAPSKTMDGDAGTIWNSGGGGVGRNFNNWWIQYDLGSLYTVQGIRIQNWGDTTHDARTALVKTATSQGGTFGTTVASLSLTTGTSAAQDFSISYGSQMQHIQLNIKSTGTGYQPYVSEVAFLLDLPTPTPTPSPTPSPTPTPTYQPNVGEAAATGDPHLQNVHGERFDLMKTGKHVLINIPRGTNAEHALLRVQADARRLGDHCSDMYFQEVNVTGTWAEAKKAGGYIYSASQYSAEPPEWITFGKIELKVVHGRTGAGTMYLNMYAKHLRLAGVAIGGLLGEDDHEDASIAPEGCVKKVSLRNLKNSEGDRPSVALDAVASLE